MGVLCKTNLYFKRISIQDKLQNKHMKKLLYALVLCAMNNLSAQFLLAGWDFQTTTNGGTAAASAPSTPTLFNANFGSGTLYINGTNGSSTWVTATSGNELTSFSGTSSVNSTTGFSTSITSPASLALVNSSANGKSIVFQVDMTGSKNLTVSYATQRTSTGFTTQTWEYSTNGTSWTSFSTQSSIPSAFGQIILPTVTALDNISTAFIRLTVTGASTSGGNNRLDNIQFRACKTDVTLATSSVSGLVEQCTESGWTYFADPATNNIIFGINKNGNTFTVNANITIEPAVITKTSSNGTNQEHGMWLMRRYWDASVATGSISSASPISIRFYYDPADVTAAKDARDISYAALGGSPPLAVTNGTTGEWFKTQNGTTFNTTFINSIVGNRFPSPGVLKPSVSLGTQNSVNYVEYSGLTGLSGGTIGFSYGPKNTSNANSLPVTWRAVDVTNSESGREISWETSSEQNSRDFIVEFSQDGQQFNAVSKPIAAAGMSQTSRSYSFIHGDQSLSGYYRIRQTDINGAFSYSKLVYSAFSSDQKLIPTVELFSNPPIQDESWKIKLANLDSEYITVALSDFSGRVIKLIQVNMDGLNTQMIELPSSGMAPGTYLLSVTGKDLNFRARLAK